jgi:hypothetical protein
MFSRHLGRVAGWPAWHPRPKLTDFGEMVGPVLDPFIEQRTNQSMLSNIRVEMPKQRGDSLLPTNPIQKAWVTLIHIADRRIVGDYCECDLSATSIHVDNVVSLCASGLNDHWACLLGMAEFALLRD